MTTLEEARAVAVRLADVVDRLMAGCLLNRVVLGELAGLVADEALPAADAYERLVLEGVR